MLDLILLQMLRVFGLGVMVLVLIASCVFAVLGVAAVFFGLLAYFGSFGL